MIALAAAACLLAQSDLVERLGDDDPAVRDAASAAIHRLGARAIPDLERVLDHPCPEVRGRAADLLERLPEYAATSIRRSPDYPALKRLWVATVEAQIGKRPVPKALWEEIGPEEEREVLVDRMGPVPIRPHMGRELCASLREMAVRALREIAGRVGVEGSRLESALRSHQRARLPRRVYSALIEARPDAESFEEVYGTLCMLARSGLHPEMDEWSDSDWETVAKVLVGMRRRPGAPALEPPVTLDEALTLASRGPIVRGIADALGRAFANRGRGHQEALAELGEGMGKGEGEVRALYELLVGLDEQISRHFYRPGLLEPATAALPLREAPVPDRHRSLFDKVRSGATSDGALRVVREILENLGGVVWKEGDVEVAAALLRSIGERVAEVATCPAAASGTPR